MRHRLVATMSGAEFRVCFEACSRWDVYEHAPPTQAWIGGDELEPAQLPAVRSRLAAASRSVMANWFDEHHRHVLGLTMSPGSELVSCSVPDAFETAGEALALIEPLPFEICALGSYFFEDWHAMNDRDWGFARSHAPHGWGCLFRGAGHDRLLSRRWLDFGPWRVVRRPNDTTFVQFHDLAITDAAEAYEQAKVGHQRMGIDSIGGFIQGIDVDVISQVGGIYFADERKLELVVGPGNEVRQHDMLVACGLRLYHRLEPAMEQPIDRIAYVFMDRGDAHAHLHELWLRELECWYVDGGGKHRLDANYRPTPRPPAWVVNLGSNPANRI
jgi:hypothetical protein